MEPSPFDFPLFFYGSGEDEDQSPISPIELGDTHNASISISQRQRRVDQRYRNRTSVTFVSGARQVQPHADGIAVFILDVTGIQVETEAHALSSQPLRGTAVVLDVDQCGIQPFEGLVRQQLAQFLYQWIGSKFPIRSGTRFLPL